VIPSSAVYDVCHHLLGRRRHHHHHHHHHHGVVIVLVVLSLAVFGRRLKTELFRRCYNGV